MMLAPILVRHRPPFGFAADQWDDLGRRTGDLVGLLGEGNAEEATISEEAGSLVELLRVLV